MLKLGPIKPLMGGAALLVAAGCGTTINPGQSGLRYSGLGMGLHHDVKNEGFYFEWPWDDVVVYDTTWQSKTREIEILTADALHLPIRATVTFRPRRRELYELATEIGPTYYADIVEPPFLTLTRAEFSRFEHNQLAAKSPQIEQSVTGKLRKALEGKHVDVDGVTIAHLQFDARVTSAISEKRATAERVEQKKSELQIAKQDAEIERTKASGQADAIRRVAEGQAAAIIVKGEAQARAQEAIGKTLTPDYLRYKAFDNNGASYYFVPVGKDGMPLIIEAKGRSAPY